MPTDFDAFTPSAAARFINSDSQIEKHKKVLQNAMGQAGFYILPNEWWHFTDRKFERYRNTISLKGIHE